MSLNTRCCSEEEKQKVLHTISELLQLKTTNNNNNPASTSSEGKSSRNENSATLPSWVLNVYVTGSRSFRMAAATSDFDVKIIIKDSITDAVTQQFPNRRVENELVDVKMYSESFFEQKLMDQEIQQIVCLYLPEDCIWKAERKFSFVLRYYAFEHALWKEADKNWGKAFRLWKKTNSDPLADYKAKKCIVHCLRFLYFGLQIVRTGRIYSTTVANDLLVEIRSLTYSDPKLYRDRYEPLKKRLYGQMRKFYQDQTDPILSFIDTHFSKLSLNDIQTTNSKKLLSPSDFLSSQSPQKHAHNNNSLLLPQSSHLQYSSSDSPSSSIPPNSKNILCKSESSQLILFLNMLDTRETTALSFQNEAAPPKEINTTVAGESNLPYSLNCLARWFSIKIIPLPDKHRYYLHIDSSEFDFFKVNLIPYEVVRESRATIVQYHPDTRQWKKAASFRPSLFYYIPLHYLEPFQLTHFNVFPLRLLGLPCEFSQITSITLLDDGVDVMLVWQNNTWEFCTVESLQTMGSIRSAQFLSAVKALWQALDYRMPHQKDFVYLFSVYHREFPKTVRYPEDHILFQKNGFLPFKKAKTLVEGNLWKSVKEVNIFNENDLIHAMNDQSLETGLVIEHANSIFCNSRIHSELLSNFFPPSFHQVLKSKRFVALQNLMDPQTVTETTDEDFHRWGEEDFNFEAINKLCIFQLCLLGFDETILCDHPFIPLETFRDTKKIVDQLSEKLQTTFEKLHTQLQIPTKQLTYTMDSLQRQKFAQAIKECDVVPLNKPLLFEMKKTGIADPRVFYRVCHLKYLEAKVFGTETKKNLKWDYQ